MIEVSMMYTIREVGYKPKRHKRGYSLVGLEEPYPYQAYWLKPHLNPNRFSAYALEMGERGEQAVADILSGKGFKVIRNSPPGPDLIVGNGIAVEVKTRSWVSKSKGEEPYCVINLETFQRYRVLFSKLFLVIRLLSDPPCHLVIPAKDIPDTVKNISISGYSEQEPIGDWSKCREAWEPLERAIIARERGTFLTHLLRKIKFI